MSDDIPGLLRDALRALQECGAEAALMGGCARNAYAEARATGQVDFVVRVSPSSYEELVETLSRHGFHRTVGGEPGPVPDLELFRDALGRRLDLLYAHSSFELEALARSEVREPYAGISTRVVSPEDLIVYKLIAGRTQDRLDIVAMLDALLPLGRELDWAYVERWCDHWEVRPGLERLRAESLT